MQPRAARGAIYEYSLELAREGGSKIKREARRAIRPAAMPSLSHCSGVALLLGLAGLSQPCSSAKTHPVCQV